MFLGRHRIEKLQNWGIALHNSWENKHRCCWYRNMVYREWKWHNFWWKDWQSTKIGMIWHSFRTVSSSWGCKRCRSWCQCMWCTNWDRPSIDACLNHWKMRLDRCWRIYRCYHLNSKGKRIRRRTHCCNLQHRFERREAQQCDNSWDSWLTIGKKTFRLDMN